MFSQANMKISSAEKHYHPTQQDPTTAARNNTNVKLWKPSETNLTEKFLSPFFFAFGNIICAHKLFLKFYYKSRNPLSSLFHSAETVPLNFLADSSLHILNNMLKLLLQNFSLLCIILLTSSMEKGCHSLLHTTTHMLYCTLTIPQYIFKK